MERVDTVIIGGGQAGLAISRCLGERGIEHVVLERGRVAQRWRSAHWDSLRLLTPNWQSRLPGQCYDGPDPDGFMSASEVAQYLERYAHSFAAPVRTDTRVLAVAPSADGYSVTTDRGDFRARAVVIATGYCDAPLVPRLAGGLPAAALSLTPGQYRNPEQLPPGGVLVVGASATGVQLADEIQRSGRQVTLSVGSHTRMPRRYRGKDIMGWLDRMGVLDEPLDPSRNAAGALREPSLQLAGRTDLPALDLDALRAAGVRLAGRTIGASAGRVLFADDLAASTRAADAKLARLLDRIDAFATASGLPRDDDAHDRHVHRATSLRLTAAAAPTALNLQRSGISTVLWATGYSRSYPWLQLPSALDARGELRQRGGVCDPPGLYALGLRFQHRRNSSFLDGVGRDARELAAHIAAYLGAPARAAA